MQDFLKEIIKEAGFLAKGYYHEGVEHTMKSDPTNLVTIADTTVSDFIIGKIKEKYPDHGIISEEEKEEINPNAQYTWVIDPIDGTRNFANHIAFWCVMIGLMKNRQPYLGAIYDALNDELFFAETGKGAFLNGAPIKVSACDDLESFSLSFCHGSIRSGSPYNSTPENHQRYLKFYHNLIGENGHWVSNMGCMLPTCGVASGRVDAIVHNSALFHDYLAAYVICTEAGAIFTNSRGEPWQYTDKDIVVANKKLHPKLIKLFGD